MGRHHCHLQLWSSAQQMAQALRTYTQAHSRCWRSKLQHGVKRRLGRQPIMA